MTETDVFERIEALSEDYHNILDAKNREIERLKNCLDKEIKEKEIENEIYKLVNEQQSLERNSAIIRKYHKSIAFANKENKLSPYDGWQQIKSSMSLFSLLYKNRI